jgi:hypothetical protein
MTFGGKWCDTTFPFRETSQALLSHPSAKTLFEPLATNWAAGTVGQRPDRRSPIEIRPTGFLTPPLRVTSPKPGELLEFGLQLWQARLTGSITREMSWKAFEEAT